MSPKALRVTRCPHSCGQAVVTTGVPGRPGELHLWDHPPEVRGALGKDKRHMHMVATYTPHRAVCPNWREQESPTEQADLGV